MRVLILTVLAAMVLGGCGKVSTSPRSPLVDPPVRATFDAGLAGWAWRFSGPGTRPVDVVTWTTDRTFQSSPGAVKLDAQFTGIGDTFDSGFAYGADTDLGLPGKVMSMWAFWESGLSGASGRTIAKFYVKLGSAYAYASGPEADLQEGRWTQVVWSVDSPSYKVPSLDSPAAYQAALRAVREVGVELYAVSGSAYSPGVVYLDHLAY
jgi:hypothetical protein